MKLLYFAWLKSHIGTGEEERALPETVTTVGQLIDWLKEQGPGYAKAFAEPERLRMAVDQDYARQDTPIGQAREVAFFPPVTGG